MREPEWDSDARGPAGKGAEGTWASAFPSPFLPSRSVNEKRRQRVSHPAAAPPALCAEFAPRNVGPICPDMSEPGECAAKRDGVSSAIRKMNIMRSALVGLGWFRQGYPMLSASPPVASSISELHAPSCFSATGRTGVAAKSSAAGSKATTAANRPARASVSGRSVPGVCG
ncbi:hypothetical protein RW1_041_00510 [Rhodococcus wratislaviensis NBRC 100605]|uniref:Uncharacterized protein n=1 Tax=Rhodococcus wratislaviensis NBRC 100605 TaxID=1219028 RepID=X0R956_RHOWR|nr:hypothetical protein RW1_041_00510 [Rhodococcus wratislaviensis NBRC 100605]